MSSNVVKYIKSLGQTKFRQMYNNFVVEGNKNLAMVLNQNIFEIELVAYHKSQLEIEKLLLQSKFPVYAFDSKQMSQISQLKSASNVVVVLKKKTFTLEKSYNKIFFLDGIQDPGNVGTIIRIADWFGFDAVIRSNNSADFYNPKVIQATMGSFIGLPLINMDEIKEDLADYTWYGADMDGENINKVIFDVKSIIVMGNEGQGISKNVGANINKMITISGDDKRNAESLNVASAASIFAYKVFNN
jgi:TrmH family RNA methyltransferase